MIGLNVFCSVKTLFAQDTLSVNRKNSLGFVTGIGTQYLGQLAGIGNKGFAVATNYYYHVRFYELQYYRTIKRNRLSELDLLMQPQYNVNKYGLYPESTEFLDGYEFGLNVGFLYRKSISGSQFSYYLSLSTGPHYASGVPHRQMSGFLFSNNLFAGLNIKLYKGLYADTRFGIRHMSNAGTRLPNAGVNNVIIKEGFIVEF
ncbi:acyloxyacyl hydrolase [Mucilaginibacter sp. UR6-11]|uniref:acyloxyacyl hydrolase n=1 Tax=Mucilaginibacter sp. UR6-11 TaxID=1435644 RepID=UPI001E33551E|nr:acyloxyacyl hydrolase [Mucilaginibacter sp. UR6-11]MCC8423723.1 acyloxyacyl hydrolase [Mucilaginibacter sp. UR6-11]